MKNFTIEEAGHTLQFITMNRRQVQLFQVYATIDGQQQRFHMQLDPEAGNFFITYKGHCPAIFHQLEKQLSDAIKSYGVVEVVPT